LALRLEPIFKEKAKENQREHGGTAPGKTLTQKSAEAGIPGETRRKLAQMAGVSHDTIKKVKKLSEAMTKKPSKNSAGTKCPSTRHTPR
jgi:hypothetical protein